MKTQRIGLPLLTLALNWIVFAGVSGWISAAQRNLLWWLRLDWSSWLTQLGAFAKLGSVPAGSLWILWLALSACWTVGAAWLAWRAPAPEEPPVIRREPDVAPEMPVAAAPQWQFTPDDPVLVAHAGLREKIQRLHQSLNRI